MDAQSNPRTDGESAEPRRRRRWPFIVGGLVALGLLALAVGVVVLVLAVGVSGPGAPVAAYQEEY
ncbi:MAG: hypothetical protein M3341_00380, partial [Actinomycetota bacterium]|nr:hypothetical protein [Actinomycetota bacterium]